ncbi:MAG: ABC transporter substrate-binding protein [Pseudomonadota bacterium]
MANSVKITRRAFGALGIAFAAAPALAVNANDASALVTRAVADVQSAIGSGKTGNALFREFRKIFDNYADVPLVAAGSLGVAWRSASDSQKSRYIAAFREYLAKKYGRRFNEFSGSEFDVKGTSKTKRGFSVTTDVSLASGSTLEVDWQVRDVKGSPLIFDIVIEGISMLVTERGEIGAMLDARGNDLDRLIRDLPNV